MEVGFRLGPRLNAAGRMGHAREAMELFTTATGERAEEIAKALSKQNDERREVERAIFERACEMAESAGMTRPGRRAIVLAHEEWHAGVVGIACSRLVERYHRPVILMQKRDGSCHGSGRSIDGFNLHAGLMHCADHLDKFGGHTMAAGLHLAEPKLPAFVDAFTTYANSAIGEELLSACVRIDCEASADELTVPGVHELDRLGPFGAGNPTPQVLVRGVRILDRATMGAAAKHLSLRLRLDGAALGAREWRCVAWGWGEHAGSIAVGSTADVVIRPRVSTFSGTARVEPEIVDISIRA
jgi:single-stranded-DNA-specific exonuclease